MKQFTVKYGKFLSMEKRCILEADAHEFLKEKLKQSYKKYPYQIEEFDTENGNSRVVFSDKDNKDKKPKKKEISTAEFESYISSLVSNYSELKNRLYWFRTSLSFSGVFEYWFFDSKMGEKCAKALIYYISKSKYLIASDYSIYIPEKEEFGERKHIVRIVIKNQFLENFYPRERVEIKAPEEALVFDI